MVKRILKISGIALLGLITYLVIDTLIFNGIRSFYCLSNEKCVTVWKRTNGETYIMFGEYKSKKIPSDNYIKTKNTGIVDIIWINDNRLLIDSENNAEIIQPSSDKNLTIERYSDDKFINDSLYTYFDGRYNRYNKKVNYIRLHIKENYATDRTGKKLK